MVRSLSYLANKQEDSEFIHIHTTHKMLYGCGGCMKAHHGRWSQNNLANNISRIRELWVRLEDSAKISKMDQEGVLTSASVIHRYTHRCTCTPITCPYTQRETETDGAESGKVWDCTDGSLGRSTGYTLESELKSSPHTLEQCLNWLYIAVTSPGRCGQKQVEEIYLHTRRKKNNNRQWLDWPMFNQVHRTECRRIDGPRWDLEHSINPQCPSFFSEISGVFVHCSVSCLCDIFHNDILIPDPVSHFLQKIKFEFAKQMKNIRR